MRKAAAAGVQPLDFYRMTVVEVIIAIEGYHERERQSLISRVNAVVRGLSTMGKKKVDPYKGLMKAEERKATADDTFERVAKRVFKPADGVAQKPANDISLAFRRAREKWFWGE